jgi:hypothetical protein
MLDHRVTPVDDGWDDLLIPEQETAIADARVQHEAHAGVVALALHAIDASASTTIPHPFGTAYADPIGSLIGACRESLSHGAIDVLGDPADTDRLGILVHLIFREVVCCA